MKNYEVYISTGGSSFTLWEVISSTDTIVGALKDFIEGEGLEENTISDYILVNANKAYVECDEEQVFMIKIKK